MKKNIFLLIMLIITTSIFAGINDNVSTLYDIALNKDVGYLSAEDDLNDAIDDLDEDPLIYDSSISLNVSADTSSSSDIFTSTLSIEVPILDQLQLAADIDTDLDGALGFTYSPLVVSDTHVSEQVTVENNKVYLDEYKDDLKVEIAEAYINYLLAIENLKQQESQAELDKALYEETLNLYKYDEATLTEVQEDLLTYNESSNDISDFELAVYSNKITLVELIGIENSEDIVIPETDINELIILSEELFSILENSNYSIMSSYDVIKAVNTTKELEDSFDTMKWYDPTLTLSGEVDIDGDITASITFKTSFDDFNTDEKEAILVDIELSEAETSEKIFKIQNEIDILERTIESNKKQIDNIKNQIEENNYVMEEAYSLLNLGEYEELSYQELLINENELKLSLINAYATLYVNQLTLVNYL